MTAEVPAAPSDLTTRLGLAPDARVIILNADDLGMCRAANRAISELLLAGRIDSATVMVPCAWAPDALAFAAAHPVDVGVHLVLTSEWTRYRWRPLTGTGTSLVDDAGYFPRDVATVERQARDEDVAAELAARHGLPFRLPRTTDGMVLPPGDLQPVLDEATAAADALGVVVVDRLWTHPFELAGEGTPDEEDYADVKAGFLDLLRRVRPGVTEIYLHPMLDDDELGDVADHSVAKRGFERRLLADPDVSAVIAEEGLVRVGWRDLRAVQRGER